ncbi:MAG TPA: glycosyltransferase [Thermoanaerobaculia bacterium]|nr:glycosyltransferase [Thermoanaerobaculia bacterium]
MPADFGLSPAVFLAAGALALGPGYLLSLRRFAARRERTGDPESWPAVDAIVPAHDEARRIEGKIRNLRALAYPGAIRFWVVDGASADGTREIAAEAIAGDPRFSVVAFPIADKTAQINRALPLGEAKWVLVTDADARLAPDTITKLVREAEADASVGAVGTTVRPSGSHPSERLHWGIADRLRLAEGRRGAASIVTAPCYLFRREGAVSFPRDVVADDVHAAFRAAASGCRVAFVAADVEEIRNPVSVAELVRHKRRKARAYLREVVRFLPRTAAMTPAARSVFRWRAAQMLLGPPVLVALGVATLAGVAAADPTARMAAAGAAALLSASRRARAGAGLAAVLALALLLAVATLPFRRDRATFPKIDAARRGCPDPDLP